MHICCNFSLELMKGEWLDPMNNKKFISTTEFGLCYKSIAILSYVKRVIQHIGNIYIHTQIHGYGF